VRFGAGIRTNRAHTGTICTVYSEKQDMTTMTLRALVTAATATATTALAFAVPTYADPPSIDGTYAIDGNVEGSVITVTSNCATEGCTATVTSTRGWTSLATMTGGMWNFTVTKPDGVVCDDGNYAPIYIRYSVDPATLTGSLTADSGGQCPGGQVTQTPFRLRKVS